MTKETRLESILIRFDQDGNVKGAAAYDFEQDRDDRTGEVTPLRGELPARPISVADLNGIMTGQNVAVVQNNVTLQAEKEALLAQVQAEMTGRTTAETTLTEAEALSEQRRSAVEQLEADLETERAAVQAAGDVAASETAARQAAETAATSMTAAIAAKDSEISRLSTRLADIENPVDPLAAAFTEDERKRLRSMLRSTSS